MPSKLVFNTEDCVACNACVMACIDQNDTDSENGEPSCRKSLEYEPRSLKNARTVACLHCANAKCIEACPNDCITRDQQTGFVVFDDEACIGCRACLEACPFNAIHMSPDNKIRKCDGCNERVKHGLKPACVLVCPTQALKLVELQ
jgi:anaerobic dimethyl sulfoxide reductase subunit B (iron-sulfur subunit)